ncbi:MAG: alanyl-tRNA synthetase [Candidatus Berkelbacteria bacterium Licking1014_2]|uniref:alanine--tRNA ligase n=1 Tax=Candidatus Berkelbacteria bacterium Licking1014_2 TaxID=2017146 RepID=A0A554LUW4_9BACT|nr:MAG: alanyl-tRNA synthetase [Candidatus Berkelbacteria bacterium Licking1014_2]
MMTSRERTLSVQVKQKFSDFFQERGYKNWPAGSLIPDESDPSVLFTTAGMQQFKGWYTTSQPSTINCQRTTTCQPCLRTSDIDEVGDENHLTFFEMLGNFSFGEKDSYKMKKRAIEETWEFVTKELNIEPKRITVSVFSGDEKIEEDKESLAIWQEVAPGVEIKKQGREDNFWGLGPPAQAGRPSTPCGRTTEIYVDGIEIWNLVFNEFVDNGDGSFRPMESFGLDTGMGLERLMMALEDTDDIFATDIYRLWRDKLAKISRFKYQERPRDWRIIIDHLRAATALAEAGIIPGNKDRGYILRRLIRRALVYGQNLGIENIGQAFSDLPATIKEEEEKFGLAIKKGKKELEEILGRGQKEIPGQLAFDLFQTYGLPLEIIKELAGEQNIKIDEDGFFAAAESHRQTSRQGMEQKFAGGLADDSNETIKYHTACHLLLAALRKVLGGHVVQKGSNITNQRLRFDFSHPEKMTPEQVKAIEDWVNDKIKRDLPVATEEMTVAEAKESGAMGVFDERYGERVKVYTIADPSPSSGAEVNPTTGEIISKEICGGPHVKRTEELGDFKITKEESSSAGVRRVKAVLTKK